MKSTEIFKRTIQNYLEQRAIDDTLFTISYRKPNKSIDECINYILNTVQKSGCNGFTDDEVFSMAVHYYDEDSIEAGKSLNCQVVVNHTVELTEEEKQQVRKDAIQRAQNEAYASMKKPLRNAHTKQSAVNNQPNLFNL
jgi:hypothetical protein